MAECTKCIHKEVCKTAESCDGYVSGCKHFNPGWISVKDRLPPYNHDVLVYRPNMASKILVDCYVGYYGEDDGEWYEDWARYGKDIHNKPLITHWAEMLQPPKGE